MLKANAISSARVLSEDLVSDQSRFGVDPIVNELSITNERAGTTRATHRLIENGIAISPEDRPTVREREILALMADGLTTENIASRLGIAFKTAASHRWRILGKFGADNTVTVVRLAIRMGLIEP
jgi:DNA-binding NarL/FixJ family response regulator